MSVAGGRLRKQAFNRPVPRKGTKAGATTRRTVSLHVAEKQVTIFVGVLVLFLVVCRVSVYMCYRVHSALFAGFPFSAESEAEVCLTDLLQKRVEENRRHTTCLSKEELNQAMSHNNSLPTNQSLQDNPVRQKSSDSGYVPDDHPQLPQVRPRRATRARCHVKCVVLHQNPALPQLHPS